MKLLQNFIPLLIILYFTTLHAQDKVMLGAHFGGTHFFQRNDYNGGLSTSALGIATGLSAQMGFTKDIHFALSILYHQKGIENTLILVNPNGFPTGKGVIKYRYDYLEFSFLPRWYISKKPGFFINFGPYIAYLNDSRLISDINDGINTSIVEQNYRLDAGFALGLGFMFSISDMDFISLEARHAGGLIDVYKEKSTYPPSYNHSSVLLLGYQRKL